MARLGRVLSAAVIVGAGAALVPSSVQAQTDAAPTSSGRAVRRPPVTQIARLVHRHHHRHRQRRARRPGRRRHGHGHRRDHGAGVHRRRPAASSPSRCPRATTSCARTSPASPRRSARSCASAAPPPTVPQLQIRRLDATAGTTGTDEPPLPSRPIIAAGFSLPQAEPSSDEPRRTRPRTRIRTPRPRGGCATSSAAS